MFYNFNDHTTDMNREALAALNIFAARYDAIAHYHLRSESPEIILGEGLYMCRFCGRGAGETTFKKIAHAIPHATGNRWLFSHYECDECNTHFGRILENQFGNFMHLHHTLSHIKGKKGASKFIQANEGISIVNDGKLIDWQGVPQEDINYDQAGGLLTVKQRMPGFIPVAVYKTLVKIALTIMPEPELQHFRETITWLNEKSHEETSFKFESLWMIFGSFENNISWDQLSVVLSKRKLEDNLNLPYMLFNLSYANFDFQLPVPLCSLDKPKTFNYQSITYLPHLCDLKYGLGKLKLNAMTLHGRETVRGETMTIIVKDLDGTGTVQHLE